MACRLMSLGLEVRGCASCSSPRLLVFLTSRRAGDGTCLQMYLGTVILVISQTPKTVLNYSCILRTKFISKCLLFLTFKF